MQLHTRLNSELSGCSKFKNVNYSKSQIEWLEIVMKEEHIFIQHAKNGGEKYLPNIGKIDGFCDDTNTVYEFHDPDDINLVNGKLMENYIRRLYDLIRLEEQDIHLLKYGKMNIIHVTRPNQTIWYINNISYI
jgi:hypothetical protein